MANASIGRFKARLANIPVAMQREISRELQRQGDAIAGRMRAKAPVGTGKLRQSVRTEKGDLRVRILAGGEPTKRASGGVISSFIQGFRDGARGRRTRRAAKSATYDYAFANEFGTQKMRAQPFFYPTFRAMRGSARKAIRATVKRVVQNG